MRRFGFGFGCNIRDQDDAEVSAHGEGAREHLENHIGSGAGGDIVVRRDAAQEQVADASSGEAGVVAGLA